MVFFLFSSSILIIDTMNGFVVLVAVQVLLDGMLQPALPFPLRNGNTEVMRCAYFFALVFSSVGMLR